MEKPQDVVAQAIEPSQRGTAPTNHAAQFPRWMGWMLLGILLVVGIEIAFITKSKMVNIPTTTHIQTFGVRGAPPMAKGKFWGPMYLRLDVISKRIGLVDINFNKVIIWNYQTGKLLHEIDGSQIKEGTFNPSGLEFDREGNLYILDRKGSGVYQFSTEYTLQRKWEVSSPIDIKAGPDNTICIYNGSKNELLQFDPQGQEVGRIPTKQLKNPVRLAMDENGTTYFLDIGQKAIVVYDAHGRYRKTWKLKVGKLSPASALTYRNGSIYFCETNLQQILIFNLKGKLVKKINMAYPVNMDVDENNRIYLTGHSGIDIYELNP
ncbi:hypothetical protein K8S19_07675 [bacterium]|nr:hypothetical protein [bacterium]